MIDAAFVGQLEQGQVTALARAVSIVENGRPGFESLLSQLHPRVGRARRIGVTGPPGAGKSTITEQLVRLFRAQGLTVGVVAVDPTSPFTGGALLGDRIRMEGVALDPGVYIRSMATRGSLGGLATSTREVCDVIDAAGFDRIIIETVGVGQSELDVAKSADVTVLALVPESGDGIQALKAGVMEVADVFVVNKADRSGADTLRREIETALDLRLGKPGRQGAAADRPAVLVAAALKGEGMAELAAAVDARWELLVQRGELDTRRRDRLAQRTREVVDRAVRRWVWRESRAEATIAERIDEVVAGRVSPYDVAGEVVTGFTGGDAGDFLERRKC